MSEGGEGGAPSGRGGSLRSRGAKGDEERAAEGESEEPQIREEGKGPRRRTVAERTTLAVSVFLIVLLLALVTRVWLSGGSEPPVVEARPLLEAMRHEGEAYSLPVEVTNHGGRTAAEVVILAELTGGDGSSEERELTLDFLAGGETREGTVVFASDPASGELTVDVASFQ